MKYYNIKFERKSSSEVTPWITDGAGQCHTDTYSRTDAHLMLPLGMYNIVWNIVRL